MHDIFSPWRTCLNARCRCSTVSMKSRFAVKPKQLLREYEQPPLDPAIDDALQDYVARRKQEMGTTG